MNALPLLTPGPTLILGFTLLLSACAVSPDYTPPLAPGIPSTWQQKEGQAAIETGWLAAMNDPQLEKLVDEALHNNHQLAAQNALLEQARQQLIISGAPRIPELSAALNVSQRQIRTSGARTTAKNIGLTLDLNWEIDLWGKLRDTQKQAALSFAAREAELEITRQQLVAAVGRAWYDVLEAQSLLTLYKHRLNNLGHNLDIIETGYRQGLNPALDLYLTRNSIQQDAARTEAQQLVLAEAARQLQLLLGRYPDGSDYPSQPLPLVEGNIPAGLPSELISRRPELRSAWLDLMAADAGVAVSHKQRFPRLTITGSTGQSSSELKNLLTTEQHFWSLAGGLLQPLFNAGELAAREEQARARLAQLEKQYLDNVYQAFAETETALARENSLAAQYLHYLEAEKNALAAERLSFEQYQRGLLSYATVLESQRRAFDAQSTVVQLRHQRLYNRIALYTALGGSFDGEDS